MPSLRQQKRRSAQEARALGLELRDAVKRGDLESARNLIHEDANVNAVPHPEELRALAFPCASGNTEMAKLLLENGADPLAKTQGLTWAARWGRIEIVNLLLEYGASPNDAECGGLTPLGWAKKRGHLEVVQRLQEAGARDEPFR